MKIALLGHKRIPSREGGVEIVVHELAVRMAAQGHQVTVYNRNCGEPKEKCYHGVRLVEVPTSKKSSLNALLYSLFATLHVLFHSYDVVHYHAEGPCAMLPLAKLLGKKTVATIHGLDWQRSKWGGFATRYLLFGEKMAARFADELIVLTPSAQDYFLKTYRRETRLIPNGVNPAEKKAPSRIKKYGLEARNYLLFLARLTPEKGLDYLLDAFCKIKTDKKLVIAGRLDPSTPYIEEIKQKAKGDDRVCLVGFVEGQELAELFSNCYLYVLPSDVEGLPISLLEAVSYRARVLVSDIPENTGLLNGYGHCFKKGSTAALEASLRTLLEQEPLYDSDFKPDFSLETTEAQIDRILSAHDWDHVTGQTLRLYETLLPGKKPRP